MRKLFASLLIALATVVVSSSAFAADVWVKTHVTVNSCGYYSSTTGRFAVFFGDQQLPWGTRVTLIHGLNGVKQAHDNPAALEWQIRQETQMMSAAPFTWHTEFDVTLAQRSSPERFDRLAMVFRVELPTGETYFENGGSEWGFYEAKVGNMSTVNACSPSPDYETSEIGVIVR